MRQLVVILLLVFASDIALSLMSSIHVVIRPTTRFGVIDVVHIGDSIQQGADIRQVALDIFNTADLDKKCARVYEMCKLWESGSLSLPSTSLSSKQLMIPDAPARPSEAQSSIEQSQSQSQPKATAVVSLLHGICHAESYAVDLFIDLIARFGGSQGLPKEFFDDFIEVTRQEANHFLSWKKRLTELDIPYGSLPSHDGLWRAALETKDSMLERLAVINMVHEARGLDTYEASRNKLTKAKDERSTQILDNNFAEEIDHVRKGVKWFNYACETKQLHPKQTFQNIVKQKLGKLKGPFNMNARKKAGFTTDWFQELAENGK